MTATPAQSAALAAGLAVAEAVLPGTANGAIAMTLINDGLQFYTTMSTKLAAGTLTGADVVAMADQVDADLSKFASDIGVTS